MPNDTATATSQKSDTIARPAWDTFCEDVELLAQEMGVPIQRFDRANFVGFESTVNKHKFYVPKNKGEVSWCHTTLPLAREKGRVEDLPNGPGSIGKIESFVAPDLRLVEDLILPAFTASGSVLRANRRPARRKSGSQPIVQAPETPVGSEADLTAGMTQDEIDAFLKA